MRSDEEVMRYIPRPLATKVEDVEELITMMNDLADKGERFNWAIVWKEAGVAIGTVGYVRIKQEHRRGELGYSLSRQWHRKGIMREAVFAILKYGFDVLNFHSVEAVTDIDNKPSGALLENVGFRKEGTFREDFFTKGEFRTSVHYGMLAQEFDTQTLK